MGEIIHELRRHLMEAEKLAGFLSSDVSAQRIPADLAGLVDGTRHAILAAQRCAHALELGGKLIGQRSEP